MSDETTTTEEQSAAPEPQAQPLLRVVNPDATPEEVAALVAVFAAMGSGGEAPKKPVRSWNAPERLVRSTFPSGPGAWRASALPR